MSEVVLSTAPRLPNTHYYAATAPNIGLLSIASHLRANQIPTTLIDANALGLDLEATVTRIADLKPRLLGLSAYTREVPVVSQIAARVKQACPHTQIAVGGIHPTERPGDMLVSSPHFDFIVQGEGEGVLLAIARDILAGTDSPAQPRIYSSADSRTGESSPVVLNDLEALSPIAYTHFFPGRDEYAVIASRGCFAECTFCHQMYGKKVRLRRSGSVLDDIRALMEVPEFRKLSFYDESFGVYGGATRELLTGLIDMGFVETGRHWVAGTRADLVTPAFAALAAASGCRWMLVGAESPLDEQLALTSKGNTYARVLRAVDTLETAGIRTCLTFLLGLPNETSHTLNCKISGILSCPASAISVGVLIPFPGSRIYDDMSEGRYGYRLIRDDFECFTEGELCYSVNGISSVELYHEKRGLMNELKDNGRAQSY